MSKIANYTDDPAELAIEARAALRACASIAYEFDAGRFGKGVILLDPRQVGPLHRRAAINVALMGAINATAGLGCLCDFAGALDPPLAAQVLPFVQSVELVATDILDSIEEHIPHDLSSSPGFGATIELLVALQYVTRAALGLWGVP